MDFATIRNRVGFYLNFNDSTTDQDFSTARLNQAINIAYQDEVNRAMQEGNVKFFSQVVSATWAASSKTFSSPFISRRKLIEFEDITDNDPGLFLQIGEQADGSSIFWLDHKTLQWGTSGPSSARTIRIHYAGDIAEMNDDDDVPELIPDAFHNLIVWSAAVLLRQIGDEQAPQQWLMERENMRIDYWKHISRGRMLSDPDWIKPRESDSNEGAF